MLQLELLFTESREMEANTRKNVHILDSNSVMEIEEKNHKSECFNFGEKTTNETSKQLDVKREKVGDEVNTLEGNVENLKNLDLISDDSSVEILFDRMEKKINEFPEKREVQNADKNEVSKRRLQNCEIVNDQKPLKRIKLIYNVDKNVDKQKNSNENLCEIESRVVLSRAVNYYDNTVRQFVPSNCEFEKNINKDKDECIVNFLNVTNHTQVLEDMVEDDCVVLDVKNYVNMDKDIQSSAKKELKRLTPKQLDRRAGVAKKKEERELLLLERERMKKEKEEEKIRLKQEKEEERVRLKLEKEQEKKKQKEEKEKRKLAEIELKNEVRRKKEEEKRKKEEQKLEDKRKKEEQRLEDKRRKEELQRKKEEDEELLKKKITKEAEAFSSFFKKCNIKATTPVEDFTSETPNECLFMPFTKKADMRLAPVNRNPMDCKRRLEFEEHLSSQSQRDTYLIELRSGAVKPKKSGNTWPLEEKYVIIQLDEDLDIKEEEMTLPPKRFNNRRPKLLQFYENRRPPYWGTWRKKSKEIRAKKPFGKDEIFDYEIDSDDEWEEEEPGESLHGSDDEKESEDDYEVDNEFFVPHGYLSEDENPEDEIFSPETQKAKLKLLSDQFDLERKEKTKLLKPVVLGCVWFNSFSDEPSSVNPSIINLLNKRKAVLWTDNIPITVFQYENSELSEPYLSDTGTSSVKKINFPDSAIPELINLIHGSTNSRKNLAQIFLLNWNKKVQDKINESEVSMGLLSRCSIEKKIKELGKWEEISEEGLSRKKWCWNVKKDVREKYGMCDLLMTNKCEEGDAVNRKDIEGSKKISPLLITKFTKVLSEGEKKNQLELKSEKKFLPCMSLPKSLSEPTQKNVKSQLKCIKKLQDFWPTTTRNYKYCSGLKSPLETNDITGVINRNSINGENLDSYSRNKPKEQDINSELSGIDPLEFQKESSNSNVSPLNPACEREEDSNVDCETVKKREKNIVSAEATVFKSLSDRKSLKMASSDYIDNENLHGNKINTEIESGNSLVESCKISQKDKSIDLNEEIVILETVSNIKKCPSVSTLNVQIEQKERETCVTVEVPNENKCLTSVGDGVAPVQSTCSKSCKDTSKGSKTVEVSSEAKPKKRVSILFSAPRGCEIVRSDSNKLSASDSKKSKISHSGNN